MRKVNAGLFISLDGITESPDPWQFDNFDDDMMADNLASYGKAMHREGYSVLQHDTAGRRPPSSARFGHRSAGSAFGAD